MPFVVKFVELTPATNAVPYTFGGPVAVIVSVFAVIVNIRKSVFVHAPVIVTVILYVPTFLGKEVNTSPVIVFIICVEIDVVPNSEQEALCVGT